MCSLTFVCVPSNLNVYFKPKIHLIYLKESSGSSGSEHFKVQQTLPNIIMNIKSAESMYKLLLPI